MTVAIVNCTKPVTPRNAISFESPHIHDVFAAARSIYSRNASFFLNCRRRLSCRFASKRPSDLPSNDAKYR
jgi:hypothetical protein